MDHSNLQRYNEPKQSLSQGHIQITPVQRQLGTPGSQLRSDSSKTPKWDSQQALECNSETANARSEGDGRRGEEEVRPPLCTQAPSPLTGGDEKEGAPNQ